MKNIIPVFFFIALMSMPRVLAQQGEIIFRDFEPDSILVVWGEKNTMYIDLDGDSEPDLKMWRESSGHHMNVPYMITMYHPRVDICAVESGCILPEVQEEEWTHFLDWRIVSANNYYGFRIQHEDGYCYGWFYTYHRVAEIIGEIQIVHWGFDKTAFCTIPNYPLHYGQTEFIGVEEGHLADAFATVQPNPGNGQVRIEAPTEDCVVRFYDLNGRLILAKPFDFATDVDTDHWTPGLYLWEIWNGTQRQASGKWVKE